MAEATKATQGPNTNWRPLIINYLCDGQVYVSCAVVGMSHDRNQQGCLSFTEQHTSTSLCVLTIITCKKCCGLKEKEKESCSQAYWFCMKIPRRDVSRRQKGPDRRHSTFEEKKKRLPASVRATETTLALPLKCQTEWVKTETENLRIVEGNRSICIVRFPKVFIICC